jgi:hypothetical protein
VNDWTVESLFEFCVCESMATALIEHVLAHQLAQNDAVPAAAAHVASLIQQQHGVILRELVSEHVLDQSGRHALQLQSQPALQSRVNNSASSHTQNSKRDSTVQSFTGTLTLGTCLPQLW